MRRRARLGTVAVLALLAGGILGTACDPVSSPPDPSTTTTTTAARSVLDAACAGTLVASTTGTIASSALTELSGLVAGRRVDGVLWAHNDSGDSARLFAVGLDGRDLGQYSLAGAGAIDWEDVAAGPGPDPSTTYLYVADIGDNGASRASVQVYRVPEPAVDPAGPTPAPQTVSGVARLVLTYPDGPHDAEALLVDPVTGELLVVTKVLNGTTQVFRAPAGLVHGSTTALTQVATLSLGFGGAVTAADVTAAGDVVALRTYFSVQLYPRTAGSSLADAFAARPCEGATVTEAQGEALAFTRDGRAYVTASEGSAPQLHRFAGA